MDQRLRSTERFGTRSIAMETSHLPLHTNGVQHRIYRKLYGVREQQAAMSLAKEVSGSVHLHQTA